MTLTRAWALRYVNSIVVNKGTWTTDGRHSSHRKWHCLWLSPRRYHVMMDRFLYWTWKYDRMSTLVTDLCPFLSAAQVVWNEARFNNPSCARRETGTVESVCGMSPRSNHHARLWHWSSFTISLPSLSSCWEEVQRWLDEFQEGSGSLGEIKIF